MSKFNSHVRGTLLNSDGDQLLVVYHNGNTRVYEITGTDRHFDRSKFREAGLKEAGLSQYAEKDYHNAMAKLAEADTKINNLQKHCVILEQTIANLNGTSPVKDYVAKPSPGYVQPVPCTFTGPFTPDRYRNYSIQNDPILNIEARLTKLESIR